MKKIKLSERLLSAAGFVPWGSGIADVGTDHGYIPVFLAQAGYSGRIVASDIRQGPLEHARRSAEEYGVSDKIEFILSDGLRDIDLKDIDTVLIAGMGGETIRDIIKAEGGTDNRITYILQPQSKTDVLTDWLCSSGYCIPEAKLCFEAGRFYLVFLARQGVREHPGTGCCRLLLEEGDPLAEEYITKLIKTQEKILKGLMNVSSHDVDYGEHADKIAVLRQYLKEYKKENKL